MGFQNPDLAALPKYPIIIGDSLAEAGSGQTMAHIYPATGRVTREIRLGNADDVDRAVAAARAAFPAWRALPGDKRRNLFFKLADLIESRAKEFVPALVGENGSVMLSSANMPYDAAQKFRYFGGWADKIHGRTIPMWHGQAHDQVSFEPYGVIGAIVPWNGPLFAATMVIVPALAAGNCVVLKAPELAPYSVMKLVELIVEAGFPAGVVNLVTGGPDVGEAMVSHPGIDKIQFIGSGATAKRVLANAAQSLKPCGLELGGKSAVLVFDDADLAPATMRGLSGAVAANGQGCVNGTRLLIQRSIYDRYLEGLVEAAQATRMGDPFDPATRLGPVISETSMNRILGMVERGVAQGGKLLCGGARALGEFADGFYLPVSILADVKKDSEIASTEVFGPVLVAMPFDTEEEAIAIANDSEFGLGAYVHTRSLARAHRVTRELHAGQIHVNGMGEASQPNVPFGGWKQSGHGRLGGIEGLHEFLQPKNIWMNLAEPAA